MLPEQRLRQLFDAFHLELRYDDRAGELEIRVTITGNTAAELGATVEALLTTPEDEENTEGNVGDPLRAQGGSPRTPQAPAGPSRSGQLVIEEHVALGRRQK